ncbi:MAG: 50S ribosomal protein L13 [Patescibacteria group bacterium]
MEHIIDATNQRLGRLATQIAGLLQGKTTPQYDPRLSGINRIVIKNASQLAVSGKKDTQKVYYRHTGYMGHLYEETFEQAFTKSPEEVLRRAVYNMLPKNRLRAKRLKRLHIER